MRRLLPFIVLLGAFGAGFGILFAGQFGASALTSSIWIVPALVLSVIGLLGLMPSIREPEKRVGFFLAYGSVAGVAFILSSPTPPKRTMAEMMIATAMPILHITAAIGVIVVARQLVTEPATRRIALALCLGLLVVYFSGSSGGTGGGSWERWITDHLGVSLHTAEILVVAVRKTIHFTFYGLLAGLVYKAARADKAKHLDAAGLAFFFALSHSCFDELRQAQTPDRTGQVSDVIIDMLGAIVLIWLGSRAQKQPVKRQHV